MKPRRERFPVRWPSFKARGSCLGLQLAGAKPRMGACCTTREYDDGVVVMIDYTRKSNATLGALI